VELEDVEVRVDEDARRRVPRQQDPVRLALELDRLGAGLAIRRYGGEDGSGRSSARARGRAAPGQQDAGRAPHLHVQLELAVLGLEELPARPHALRRAEPEDALGLERIVQDRHDALLQRRLQVDQQVPAADQVHPRERRVGEGVVPREYAYVADRLADPIVPIRLHEEASQSLGREVLRDALRI
jgi:hypothetical protein